MASFELGTDGPSAIVVGYDASESADHALAYATGLARRQGSRLVIAFSAPTYVVAAVGASVDASGVGVIGAVQQDIHHQAERHLDGTGLPWQYYSGSGDAVRLLEEIAEKTHADAIVVGRSRHREHKLVGSVAIRLVRTARWPITVVP